ncbi:MAG TPA: fluoride efflux transporter CrcB [Dysgonamonadaceae bacterium]|jgi:CrcB protein|nr:fluoride efflux transporter CrcB [Dysgonamonadaceae bacterium]HPD43755.1 fluoride efflux transporter CrcB [Dysgonamonadaceae bacterium]HRU13208.1 fluoride efflux transporter CrcB [Dysgonamonadaceae bacterium]
MFRDILFVGLGGGIGSIMRFLTSRLSARLVEAQWLFVGTLATNLIGCFLIGILSGWMLSHIPDNQPFRLLFIVGFCGGYTTFSTFAFENYRLIEMNQWGIFLLYLLASVVLGIIAVWLGMKIVS